MAETPGSSILIFGRAPWGRSGRPGKPITQVAGDLAIQEGTLGDWVNADRRGRNGADGELCEL
jgi:transposase-like protein